MFGDNPHDSDLKASWDAFCDELKSAGELVFSDTTPSRDIEMESPVNPGQFTRYHGVLAPNHRWRGLVTPAKRGKGAKRLPINEVASPAERHAAMTWAQRRVTHH